MNTLILCADRDFQALLEAGLPHYELDFISELSKLKDLDHMNCVFQHDSYDVLILSDLGMPMKLAMRHASMLPEVRTYGTLMLAGEISDSEREICRSREVEALELPVKIRVLCDTLDRLGWPAHDLESTPESRPPKAPRSRVARSRKRA